MYCAEFGDGSTSVRQLLLRFPKWVDDAAAGGREWNARLRDAANLVTMTRELDFTLRLVVAADRFERQIFLNSFRDDEIALETLARHFLRLDDGAQGMVQLCADRGEYDAVQDALPHVCLAVAAAPMRRDGCVFAHDFQLLSALGTMGAAALAAKSSICWQGAFRGYAPDAEARRVVQRNCIALDDLRGIPAALRDYERAIAGRFGTAAYLLDECLWVDDALADSARTIVARTWHEGPGALGLPVCTLEPVPQATREVLRAAMHPVLFAEAAPLEAVSAAVPTATASATIGWQPPASWRSGAASNAATLPDSAEGYLQRIESRLTALERTLSQRSLSAEECAELRKAIGISQQDASFALVKARQILEKIVRRLYRRHRPTLPQKALLFEMIRDLTGQANRPAVLPRRIGHYLETIRVLGNLEAHADSAQAGQGASGAALSQDDVELSLLMMVNVIEWYLLEHEQSAG
ncbi:MAG TPA: DUF4145 domain-containing protein [Casimicrobiaceae bacterium]